MVSTLLCGRPHHQSRTFSSSQEKRCPISLPTPSPALGNHPALSVSKDLTPSTTPSEWNQYLSFCNWLVSLGITSSRSVNVLLSIRLLMATWESLYFFKPTIWKRSLSQEVASGWDVAHECGCLSPPPGQL